MPAPGRDSLAPALVPGWSSLMGLLQTIPAILEAPPATLFLQGHHFGTLPCAISAMQVPHNSGE